MWGSMGCHGISGLKLETNLTSYPIHLSYWLDEVPMKFFTFFLQQAKIGVYSFSPVADLYRWKDNNICFAYGIKVRCYGKHVEELIGNKGKMNKKAFPWSALPPQSLKAKKQCNLSACLDLPISCMEFLFPNEFVWPGLLIPLAKNTLPIDFILS